MAAKAGIREIHVVCNTHWDREFRETFEVTRRGLLDMLDVTLDLLERDPRYVSFTLDAHVILLEDYLEMRPERRAQVQRFLQERRLLIGPWYTLPDSMNIGGEALVRNFLQAKLVAEALGTTCMKAGYSPNNWGQPSQMPQIFRGFGVDSALIYRGISCHESPSEFIWVGADGSEIFGHRFARLARYNWYYLVYRPVTRGVEPTDKVYALAGSAEQPFRVADGRSRATGNFRLLAPRQTWDAERVAGALDSMLELEGPDSSTGLLLAMHGHDISVAHPHDPDIVAKADEVLGDDCTVKVSNLEDFLAQLRSTLDQEKAVKLHGERRMNLKEGFWTYLLPCTISARTYLKVENTAAENALAGEAEPLATLAAVLGADYPTRYLDRAWHFLLSNHTHDANAGCAPDRVCADMEYRYRQCRDIASICTEDALKHIARNIDYTALPEEGAVQLLAFNPQPYVRDEVVAAEVALPRGLSEHGLEVVDPAGKVTPLQVRIARDDSLFVDNPWDVPTYTDVQKFSVHLGLQELPALGYKTYAVRPRKSQGAAGKPTIASASDVLENEHLRVQVQADGTLDLTHKPTGRTYYGLNSYRDQGEAGNAWQQEPPERDEVIQSSGGQAAISLVENGPLSATIRAVVKMNVPRDCPDGKRRSDERVTLTIQTDYTLRAGDPRIFVDVKFDNVARDHWLRACFPTEIATDVVHADTHFDMVERAIAHPDDTDWIERFRGTAPMHQVVDLSGDGVGFAVLTTGLFEYEVLDDEERTLLLSLVRSFPIKLQVSEEKVEVLPDTGVQCPGPQRFSYALLPHAGDHIGADVLRWAQRFNNPPRAAQVSAGGKGELPATAGLLEVAGEGLAVTAVKRAAASEEFVLRLFNSDVRTRTGTVTFGRGVRRVLQAALDETPGDVLPVENGRLELEVPAKKIVTLLVQFDGEVTQ